MGDLKMPQLSDSMEEGKVLRWLKTVGDAVSAGEIVLEVETDKADMEVEALESGVLTEVRVGEGASAPVGAVLAVIGAGEAGAGKAPVAPPEAPGQALTPAKRAEPAAPAKGATPARPAEARHGAPVPGSSAPTKRSQAPAARPAAERPASPGGPRAPAHGGGGPSPGEREAVGTPPPGGPSAEERPQRVTPLARALANELGVSLEGIRGTGPGGRVSRRDVEDAHTRSELAGLDPAAEPPVAAAPGATPPGDGAAPAKGAAAPVDAERTAPRVAAGEGGPEARPVAPAATVPDRAAPPSRASRIPLSRMRAAIARRMTESAREVPAFHLSTTVAMDAARSLRASLKELAGERAPTVNHLVVKAVADALRAHPRVNCRFAGDALELLADVNVGIATAVDDGLVVPVVHGADRLPLLELARRSRELARKAQAGSFAASDLAGACLTVSNLGMHEVERFVAVITPPQAAILAVGMVVESVVVRDGLPALGWTMSLTLSCDHRCLDGALAAPFLRDVRRRLEQPAALLLRPEDLDP